MLRRLERPDLHIDEKDAAVRIAEAEFPVPFAHRLEFNAPVHGTWNIVHIGLLVPECHQIYVCADNCMRGVVLTAAEMGAGDRFSSVLIEENDLYDQNLETITIEGVSDVIRRLPYRPRAVTVFLVCLHHFVGTDAAFVFKTLEERFPDIDFMRCWMDPVMQKTGLTPEQKLKESMFRPVRPLPVDPGLVCVLGDNQALDPDSDIAQAVREAGARILQLNDWKKHGERIGISDLQRAGRDKNIHNSGDAEGAEGTGKIGETEDAYSFMVPCETYDDYLQIGAAGLFITRSPLGVHGVYQLAKRLGRPFLYLPPACGEEEIREETEKLRSVLRDKLQKVPGAQTQETAAARMGQKTCEKDFHDLNIERGTGSRSESGRSETAASRALQHALALIGDTEITIDYILNPRVLSLARRLLEAGFNVTRIYLDAILPEEEDDFLWLQKSYPELLLNATIHPKMRVLHKAENEGKMLALGPKAAWFGGTSHFVNLVDYGGIWGNSGIEKLAALMEDAWLHEKDTRSIVPRKGLGCACVL